MSASKQHWEQVFTSKSPQEVSWTQEYPSTSMELIESFKLPKSSALIDIGGGDSKLVDALLAKGYSDITVLDISKKALDRAQKRLGDQVQKVKWIVSDINDFKPQRDYAIWHDRAAFHFLTQKEDIHHYTQNVSSHVSSALIVGTFSLAGPKKCSRLPITQYSCEAMIENFAKHFQPLECRQENHTTPFNTVQNFTFSRFLKKG